MAEVVERNIEDAISEFSYIRKTKLFNENEIREILKRRRQHEYALQKRNKRITDFESYIATEIGIMYLLKIRRQKKSEFRFKDKIEKSITSRLVRLHRQICYRFQSRIDTWLRFIDFSQQMGRNLSVTRIWDRLLQVHGRTDVRLWAAAAAFHIKKVHTRSNINKLTAEIVKLKSMKQKVRKLNKEPSCHAESTAIKLELVHMNALQNSLHRSVRLSMDRSMLQGLREARRLITTGLSFNEKSAFLLIQLVKLEICAADFFLKRVLLHKQISETDISTEVKTMKQNKRMNQLEKNQKETSVEFLTEVTEDVDFMASGNAVKLVLEQFVSFPDITVRNLHAVLELSKSFPQFIDQQIVQKLTNRLITVEEQLKQKRVAQQENGNISHKEIDLSMQTIIRQQIEKMQQYADSPVEVDAALDLWNTWYPTVQSFQVLDPSSTPEAMELLEARINLVTISHHNKPNLLTVPKQEVSEALQAYNLYRTKHDMLVSSTRNLLNGLATSNWGSKSSDFWKMYILFEKNFGDCCFLPSIEWRARKTLQSTALHDFNNICSSNFSKKVSTQPVKT